MSQARRVGSICVLSVVALLAFGPRTALSAVSFTNDVTFGSTMIVGNSSYGTFRVDGGSVYNNSQTFGSVVIGSQAGSLGLVTVTDPGSQWTWSSSSQGLTVGSSGSGRLDILNGGSVVMTGSSSAGV